MKNKNDKTTHFKYDIPIPEKGSKNPHSYLSEELLVPRVNNSDTQRINMVSNHINQLVHLKSPEFPRVFTNFENQVGEYSIAYKRAQDDFEIIDIVRKNSLNYHMIVKYKSTGIYDIIHFREAVNITEDYGYKLNKCIDDKKVGDVVKKDEFLYKSNEYDDDGNFSYGVNLKALFISWKTSTYEDGIVISKSAAEKLKSYKVEKTTFSLNTNEFLLNLYGDDKIYKSFPRVGDNIDSKALVAYRRHNRFSVYYDFLIERMREIDHLNDTVIYTDGGKVVDITIYSNKSIEDLKKKEDVFTKEVLEVLEEQQNYYIELSKVLEKIIPIEGYDNKVAVPIKADKNPNKYTDELAYYWKLSHERCNDNIPYVSDNKIYDNFKMEFTILKESEASVGVKLTGRYGNKGIISKIEDDENMPITEDGERAELILNPLGVINRLNLSQLQEQFINGMSIKVRDEIETKSTLKEKEDVLFEYLSMINKNQHDFVKNEYNNMNETQRLNFFKDISKNGIYIHQPPFYGNTTMEEFEAIYKKHPEWAAKSKFVGINNPLTLGELYMIRLKHDATNKTSIRSSRNLNTKNLPAKSTLKKEKKVLISNNPLRLGNMETSHLLLTKDPKTVSKLLKSYSTNERSREDLIKNLIDPREDDDIMNLDFNMKDETSINREILEKYFNLLGISLID